jgi:hypothetical protein
MYDTLYNTNYLGRADGRKGLAGQAGTPHVTSNGGTVYVVTTNPARVSGQTIGTFAITNTSVISSPVGPISRPQLNYTDLSLHFAPSMPKDFCLL